MYRINPNSWFLICFIIVAASLGLFQHFAHGPLSVHQGAQSDRACVAWNYYTQSMDFLQPRVSENRAHEGVTGMEFPIIQYVVALLYKLFGFHDFIYRVVMFLIVFFGVFSAFKTTNFFIQKTLPRLLLAFGWFLSPIFVFYSNSYIPDTAALAFSMIAIHQYIKFYFRINQRKSALWYALFITLAGLIKITFLIPHIAIIAFVFLPFVFPKFIELQYRSEKLPWYALILPFAAAIAWYMYASHLTKSTGNNHFLQQINPAHSLKEFMDNIVFATNTWQSSLYSKWPFILLFFFGFSRIFTSLKTQPLISYLVIFLSLGFLSFVVLFSGQLRYHDYYLTAIYPLVFFMLLQHQQLYVEGKTLFAGIAPLVAVILFYSFPFFAWSNAYNMLHARYEKGNYFYQPALAESEFYSSALRQKIDSIIPPSQEIISVFDPTPNTTLYALKRRGVRIASDFTPALTNEIILNSNIQYMVLNDSMRWENQYRKNMHFNQQLLLRSGIISVWKILPQKK